MKPDASFAQKPPNLLSLRKKSMQNLRVAIRLSSKSDPNSPQSGSPKGSTPTTPRMPRDISRPVQSGISADTSPFGTPPIGSAPHTPLSSSAFEDPRPAPPTPASRQIKTMRDLEVGTAEALRESIQAMKVMEERQHALHALTGGGSEPSTPPVFWGMPSIKNGPAPHKSADSSVLSMHTDYLSSKKKVDEIDDDSPLTPLTPRPPTPIKGSRWSDSTVTTISSIISSDSSKPVPVSLDDFPVPPTGTLKRTP